jgi:hypothetical protein
VLCGQAIDALATRYHGLAEGDLAVFGFEGDDGVPTVVYMVLLSRSEADDNEPFGDVDGILGTRSMVEIPADVLSGIVERSPAGHSIRELVETERDQAMEKRRLAQRKGQRAFFASLPRVV